MTPADAADVFHDLERARLQNAVKDGKERERELLRRLQQAEDEFAALVGLKKVAADHPPREIKIATKNKRRRESTAVGVTSDWHVEERIDRKTVNGLNEYSPAIATRRVENFFRNLVELVAMCRTKGEVRRLLLCVIGDLITNMIHEDQQESNYLSPTEASLLAYQLLCGGIDYLLEHGDFEDIEVACSHGNHGRNTRKMRVSTAAKTSYEWMIYQLVAMRYAGEKRVRFTVADGYFIRAHVYDTTLRIHHGDDVRYQGGVGGITIPLNKAIAQWNSAWRADLDVLGHWHQRLSTRNAVVNGSVIGYSPYSIHIKAGFEPPQQSFFLIHPGRGKTVEAPVFVD